MRVLAVVRGTLFGTALLAAGIVGWGTVGPALERAGWRAELLRSEPPSALPVPVDGVDPSDLGDTWGDARSGGRSHEGIDIFARRRTPVRSTTPGIVVRRGENPLGGRTVSILGPGGWRHYYAHLQGYAGHSTGDRVAAGEVIGFVGTSGNAPADAPHLHYGIYAGGGPRNPYPLLVAGTAAAEAESPGAAAP
ncbi:MAG TPA: M23 family metallopeptidase [Gemmatimonadota bacterium]|nr:M23 family metallopeptidase [Gemmatimonadota bacterium]